jgi:hypothetical protein
MDVPMHSGRTILSSDPSGFLAEFECPYCLEYSPIRNKNIATSRSLNEKDKISAAEWEKQKDLPFTHDYFKLNQDEFHTVRGKTFYEREKILPGSIVRVFIKGKFAFLAFVKMIEFKKMVELSLDFMKKDAEAPTIKIESREDYLKGLNSFRQYGLYDWDSVISIFHLKKMRC